MEIFRTCTILILVSFALHFLWEYVHSSFYPGYQHSTGGYVPYLLGTIGDVLYTLGAFALVSAIKKTYEWVNESTFADYLMLVTVGALIALFVEYKGLALDQWIYVPDMPIIPLLGVGLFPVLQMAILLPVTFVLTQWIARKFSPEEI